jgi:predicted Ser/Thr protein kinase
VSSSNNDLLKEVLTELRQVKEGLRLASKELLSIEETAAMLGSSPKTIRNELSKHVFPIREIRRGARVFFKKRDVVAYVEGL